MNNIIKLLLLSSVEGSSTSPPESTLTQTKLSCESLQGAERDTCSGLSTKEQTDFLKKLKDQIDSLSDGTTKGHIKTVISIDHYLEDSTSCNNSKTNTDEGEADNSEEDSSEEVRLAKQEAERAHKAAMKAKAQEDAAKAKAIEMERKAKAKAEREAAELARQAKLEEQKAIELAKLEAEEARRKAAQVAAEAQRIARAEAEAIRRKELEAEAAAAKREAEEEAAAKEAEQRKVAEAIRKAKEEEALAKLEAEREAAEAKKRAEEEAAAAKAAEAKRQEKEALQALEEAQRAKKANAKAKNGNTGGSGKTKNSSGASDDQTEEKQMKPKNAAKNGNKTEATREFKKKDASKNETVANKIAKASDDDEDEMVKQAEEAEGEKANKKAAAKAKNVKKAEDDEEEEEMKKAEKNEEAAKKDLEDAEEEAAMKSENEQKKLKKEGKAEKKAKAAEEAAKEAESDAKAKREKAAADGDKNESIEAEEAEQLAKEKRLKAEAAQRKAEKAAAAAKKAHEDSSTCKLKEANEAKTEDAADEALKEAEKARKDAKNATKKAKDVKKAKKEEAVAANNEDNEGSPKAKQASSSEDEEEKKRQEAEAAQAKADAEAMAIRMHKEKVRKELLAAEQAAKLLAEKQARELAEKIKREADELERKAREAAEAARIKQEAEKRKAEEEAKRIEKQKAIEAEEKRKAKIAAEAEARRAEAEAKEKEQRAIRLAKEAEKQAAEEKAAKEDAQRAERVNLLEKLGSDIMKGSDKRFTQNEQFSIIQYSNKKVNLMKGKYTFKARTYQEAFERFADLVKPVLMNNIDAEFGLIGNKMLLATTSVFRNKTEGKATGKEFETDEISQMMLGLGLREDIIGWKKGLMLEGREYQMISYSKSSGNATIKLMGENYAQAKKLFDAEMKNGSHGILIDWDHSFKHWSADYNLALEAMAHWCFSKGFYSGVIYDETAAGFIMEWQTQEKIEAKIKSITGQFTGDGSAFASQQYFYIWKWSGGRVSFVQRGSFWKMGDAYNWYIEFVTQYLQRDWGADLLLVGSNTPLLSTAEWNSDINKLMIGKSIAEGTIQLKSLYEGQSQQYYMLLMNKATSALKLEALGVNSNKAHQSFGAKTAGGAATYWGVLFNSNGKIYKIVGDNSNKVYTGDYWGYWVITEYIQTSMSMWTTWVHNEHECHITLKKEEDAKKAEDDAWRRDFAMRIYNYGVDLIDNFNGTGYRFAKNEKFIGIRYNVIKSEINYWSFFQNNMDRAYENFGAQIANWAARNYQDTKHNPEEYFLFGNNRLLLSSLATTNQDSNGMNITNVVIGWAYDKQIYIPDDGLLDPDGYKGHWTLLQDRTSNKTTFTKCEEDLNRCSKKFEIATEYFQEDPKKGSRGVLIRGPQDGIKKFSVNEDLSYNSTSWSFRWSLYALVGDFMANNNDGDFDSYYVPDESTAGFEIKAPYYKNKRMFHNMVNMKQSNNRFFQVHGWWNTYYLKGPVTYYGDQSKWWKDTYGDKEAMKKDMVQILMADVDKYSSKPVMVYKPGQMLNDTRMFINFGQLALTKGYAPNNCSFKVGKGENIKMVHRDKKTQQIVFTDTVTTNWEEANKIAADTWKESTGEIWLVHTDQKVYNIYKDNQNPLGELTVLGQWIFESCPDYQTMHPTDVELGFPTIYEH